MKTHSRQLTLIAALSALLLAPAAYAQSTGRGGRGPAGAGQTERGALQAERGAGQSGRGAFHGRRGGGLAAQLDLDEAQQQQLQAQRAELRQDLEPVHEDLQELRGQLRQLWSAATPNVQAINALGDRIDELQSVIRERQVQARLAMLGILTPEQRALAAELGAPGGRGMHQGGRGQGGERGLGRGGRGQGLGQGQGQGLGQGRRGRGEAGGPGRGERFAERLDLDESQQEQIRALREAMHEELEPTLEQLSTLRDRLQAAWSAEQPSEATILALGNQQDALQSTLRERHVQFRAQVLGLLTPEQRAQAAELGPRGGRGGHGDHGDHGQGRGFGGRSRRAPQGAAE